MYAFHCISRCVSGGLMACLLLLPTQAAFAQLTLGLGLDAPESYADGDLVTVSITLDRTDSGEIDPTSFGLGLELDVPPGWKIQRDPENDCAVSTTETQQGVPASPRSFSLMGEGITYTDPPFNTLCAPIPPSGDTVEMLGAEGGGDGLFPGGFPVVLSFTFTTPVTPESGFQPIDLSCSYFVDSSPIVVISAATSIENEAPPECANPGDVNSDGFVDVVDVQDLFNELIQLPGDPLNPLCSDYCENSSTDVWDVQAIFNSLIALPNPCGG